ncbi:MAG: hypothetical protein KBG84_10755 [Planctomycetes bacterium]|nr:hypothetical protein [Planctomycetota bacterium]
MRGFVVMILMLLLAACVSERGTRPAERPFPCFEHPANGAPAPKPLRDLRVEEFRDFPVGVCWFRITDPTERASRGFARLSMDIRKITLEVFRRSAGVEIRTFQRLRMDPTLKMERATYAKDGELVSHFDGTGSSPKFEARDQSGRMGVVNPAWSDDCISQLFPFAATGVPHESGVSWTRRLFDETQGFTDAGRISAVCEEQAAVEVFGTTRSCWRIEIAAVGRESTRETIWISPTIGPVQYLKGQEKWLRCERPSNDPFLYSFGVRPANDNGYQVALEITLKATSVEQARTFWDDAGLLAKWLGAKSGLSPDNEGPVILENDGLNAEFESAPLRFEGVRKPATDPHEIVFVGTWNIAPDGLPAGRTTLSFRAEGEDAVVRVTQTDYGRADPGRRQLQVDHANWSFLLRKLRSEVMRGK